MLPPAPSHRLLIVTDAWLPQTNGVVRTLTMVVGELRAMGHVVDVIGPDRFRTIPCPTYSDIPLALMPRRRMVRLIEAFRPDALHIATEGPLGMAARGWAMRTGFALTTAFHTRFAEYLKARTGLPLRPVYAWMRHFHGAAQGTMVATQSVRDDLTARGFRNIRPWSRGVDLALFKPDPREQWDLPRPIFLHVGRVAVEKNIAAFLDLDLPGSKIVVGGGPILERLRREYPNVLFTGPLRDESLARAYAGADVFVFPSLTDTFGLVLLEALACGTPVAGFPVTGPIDVLADADSRIGAVNSDLPGGTRGTGRRSRGMPGTRRTLFLARLRGSLPVSSGTVGGKVKVRTVSARLWPPALPAATVVRDLTGNFDDVDDAECRPGP
jgi:glycosyltransferase involved in cell wall biosynthesis